MLGSYQNGAESKEFLWNRAPPSRFPTVHVSFEGSTLFQLLDLHWRVIYWTARFPWDCSADLLHLSKCVKTYTHHCRPSLKPPLLVMLIFTSLQPDNHWSLYTQSLVTTILLFLEHDITRVFSVKLLQIFFLHFTHTLNFLPHLCMAP